jgi:hypothetical protein
MRNVRSSAITLGSRFVTVVHTLTTTISSLIPPTNRQPLVVLDARRLSTGERRMSMSHLGTSATDHPLRRS